jgi:hypothetical protein
MNLPIEPTEMRPEVPDTYAFRPWWDNAWMKECVEYYAKRNYSTAEVFYSIALETLLNYCHLDHKGVTETTLALMPCLDCQEMEYILENTFKFIVEKRKQQ